MISRPQFSFCLKDPFFSQGKEKKHEPLLTSSCQLQWPHKTGTKKHLKSDVKHFFSSFFSFRVICGNWRKGWKLLFSHSISESTLLLKLLEKNPILFPFFLTDCFGAPIFALLFPRMCFCVDKFLETEFMLVMFCELWYDTREILLTAATSTKHTLITMALIWWASHSQPIVLRTYTFVWHSSHFLKSGSELEYDELNIVLFSQ